MASQQPFPLNQFPPQPQILQPSVSNGTGQPPSNTRLSNPPTSIPSYLSNPPLTRPPIPGQGSAFTAIGQTNTNNDRASFNQPSYNYGPSFQQPCQPNQQPIRPLAGPVLSPASSGMYFCQLELSALYMYCTRRDNVPYIHIRVLNIILTSNNCLFLKGHHPIKLLQILRLYLA